VIPEEADLNTVQITCENDIQPAKCLNGYGVFKRLMNMWIYDKFDYNW